MLCITVLHTVPPEFMDIPNNMLIVTNNAGEDVMFSCTADGDPEPEIIWKNKKNETLNVQPKYSVANTMSMPFRLSSLKAVESTLTITEIETKDEGEFFCQATADGVIAMSKRYQLNGI